MFPQKKRGFNVMQQIIQEEPLVQISLLPTNDIDPFSLLDQERENSDVNSVVVPDSFRRSSDPKDINIFSVFENAEDASDLTDRGNNDAVQTVSTVRIKEEPNGAIHIKEEPEELSLSNSGSHVLSELKYLCTKCVFRSHIKSEVTQHFSNVHRHSSHSIPRPCDKCDYIGRSIRDIALHKKREHPRAKIEIQPSANGEYKCPCCIFFTFHKSSIRNHLRIHCQQDIFSCDKCPYQTFTRANMEQHAVKHIMKSKKLYKFKCHLCGYMEKNRRLLDNHLILHGEGELKQCSLCPYKTVYSHVLSQHNSSCHNINSKRSIKRNLRYKKFIDSDEDSFFNSHSEEASDSSLTLHKIIKEKKIHVTSRKPYVGKKRGRKPKQKIELLKSQDDNTSEKATEEPSEKGEDKEVVAKSKGSDSPSVDGSESVSSDGESSYDSNVEYKARSNQSGYSLRRSSRFNSKQEIMDSEICIPRRKSLRKAVRTSQDTSNSILSDKPQDRHNTDDSVGCSSTSNNQIDESENSLVHKSSDYQDNDKEICNSVSSILDTQMPPDPSQNPSDSIYDQKLVNHSSPSSDEETCLGLSESSADVNKNMHENHSSLELTVSKNSPLKDVNALDGPLHELEGFLEVNKSDNSICNKDEMVSQDKKKCQYSASEIVEENAYSESGGEADSVNTNSSEFTAAETSEPPTKKSKLSDISINDRGDNHSIIILKREGNQFSCNLKSIENS